MTVSTLQPRPTSAVEHFPYRAKTTCYIIIASDGALSWTNSGEDAYRKAKDGDTAYAVWPGDWSSHLFIVDDLDAMSAGLGLSDPGLQGHEHDLVWTADDDLTGHGARSVLVRVELRCGCDVSSISVFAEHMRRQLGWNVRTSTGWGGWGRSVSVDVQRNTLRDPRSLPLRRDALDVDVRDGGAQ